MFKQIFKRIRGKHDYLSVDYSRIHYLPYRGLEDISFRNPSQTVSLMNDNEMYFAAFLRDPLERLISGYIDKCVKKRGINLCDYARWGDQYRSKHGDKPFKKAGISTPDFQLWADGLLQCPCWPEVDKHFAPQHLFCNLFQYADRFDLFRFENRTHRKLWMERAGLWSDFGRQGWKSGGSDGVSIVEYAPKSHSSTGQSGQRNRIPVHPRPKGVGKSADESPDPKGPAKEASPKEEPSVNWDTDSRYIPFYAKNSTITALLINAYRSDYVTFGIQAASWICDPRIQKTPVLIRALRSLPRSSRPPCLDLKWLWIAP